MPQSIIQRDSPTSRRSESAGRIESDNRPVGDPSADARGQRLFTCWAKYDPEAGPPSYHPLICHMIDVSSVARQMWASSFSQGKRREMSRALGLGDDEDAAGEWCGFLAGLHDLGKASPVFQLQVLDTRADSERCLRGIDLPIDRMPGARRTPHGTITAATLPNILVELFQMDRRLARTLGAVAGGHHGTFPTSSEIQNLLLADRGRGEWDIHRRELVMELAGANGCLADNKVPTRIDPATAMKLAGFVSVADWVGSDTYFFPYATPDSLAAYAQAAGGRAETALLHLGWLTASHPKLPMDFTDLFPRIKRPNDLQKSVESIAAHLDGPAMVIIEAPMGEGKTEAAMYLADRWASTCGVDGMYFALPTQATSNQMLGRVRSFLEGRYEGETVQMQLLHGHASLSAEFQRMRRDGHRVLSPHYGGAEDVGQACEVVAADWFTYRKRGLLSPFGVGTIDQALLAVLQTGHFFVRLFGLSQKTVVIDEAHAYDVYMTTLLERLLEWLGALGSPVVLLSATLPRNKRQALLSAYARGSGRKLESKLPAAVYPRVSWSAGDGELASRTVRASRRNRKTVSLEWIDGSLPDGEGAPAIGNLLARALDRGGCAAVICSTVGRAQEMYTALRRYFPGVADDGQPELELLHSRFPFEDREQKEKNCLSRFGKPGDPDVRRPLRAVLVSTQLIEQSLDLDFDIMVSDMAPADLLLQRMGRLHRHVRPRPPGLEAPRFIVRRPHVAGGVPEFDPGTAAVYDAHVLLRSWLALGDRRSVSLPGDIEGVGESVYEDIQVPVGLPEPLRKAWAETRHGLEHRRELHSEEAGSRWIGPPRSGMRPWNMAASALEEDSAELHAAHRALTRLAPPSVTVILLFGTVEEAFLDREGRRRVNMGRTHDMDATRDLLKRSVNISDRRVAFNLLDHSPPDAWRRSALLRRCRAIYLDERSACRVGDYKLRLDGELGVTLSEAI